MIWRIFKKDSSQIEKKIVKTHGFALIEWIVLPALTFTILLKIVPLSLEALQI